jgi:light-regulated signal transduction histidine kinase (bacteriophytochrome)
MSERLTSINKELEAFSYSVSHDLRAPFRHIVGYSELLKKFEGEKLSERGNRFVETIIESAVSAGNWSMICSASPRWAGRASPRCRST